jgi:hypothetical protein
MQHAFRRPSAWRVTIMSIAMGIAMLALVATSAQAKVVKVTGESAAVTPSDQLTGFLSDHSISVAPIAPATLDENNVLTLPIVGGRINTRNHHAVIAMSGGITVSKNDRSLDLRRFVAVKRAHGASVSAKVGQRRMTIARVTNGNVEVDGSSATVTGDLHLSRAAAKRINRVAGKHLVSAGALLGSVNASITTG